MSAVPAFSFHFSSSPLRLVHSVYNTNGQRLHAFYGNEAEELGERSIRKHYATIFPAEIRVSSGVSEPVEDKTVFYLGEDAYTAPAVLINGKTHYLHRDHLGSILAISDASARVVEERDFSPWGELRRLRLAEGEAISGVHSATLAFSNSLLSRGFTGHEHFNKVNLIHMNGRMYDPRLKHFLAPDNNIVNPYDPRYYDRFAYGLNNPLMLTDPTGERVVDPQCDGCPTNERKIEVIPGGLLGLIISGFLSLLEFIFGDGYRSGGNDLPANNTLDKATLNQLLRTYCPGGGSLCESLIKQEYAAGNINWPSTNYNQQDFGSLNQGNNQNQGQPCPTLYTAEACEELGYLPPDTSTVIDTSGVINGGGGPFGVTCLFNCGEPADGDDDSDHVPDEDSNPNDCTEVLVCPEGQVFDGATCACKVECPTVSGYIYTEALPRPLSKGLATVIETDNFRDENGAIIANTNCNTGKIFKGQQVNVLSIYHRTRTFIREDGSIGEALFFPIEFTKCDGNRPENQDYDPNKPCSDCDNGNPLMNMEITPSSQSGKEGGTFGCTRIGSICEGVVGKKSHDGLDLTADVNTTTYATHSGIVHSIRDTFAPGEYLSESYGNYVIIKTEIDGNTHFIKFNHLNEVSVKKDDPIRVGDIIGLSGNTGNANSPVNPANPHIHMQVFDSDWESLNPINFVKAEFDENFETTTNCN